MDFLTTTEMAEKGNISRRRVTALCIQGRVDGAFHKGNTWLIPADAQKPVDPRKARKAGTLSHDKKEKTEKVKL